jgi:hypothetical protein
MARDGEVLHLERDLRQPVHRGRRSFGIDPAAGEDPVPEPDGQACLPDDPVALLLGLDREKADGIGADVDGRDTQRGELYRFSSWR